ncbi:hypothetical protein [Micromonospora sp. LOL_021]|uniref:hypothetical protein n=1 Tax=Micromonospora sp. LOL_021 TaxID=3345417 RepID=UPI003A851F56
MPHRSPARLVDRRPISPTLLRIAALGAVACLALGALTGTLGTNTATSTPSTVASDIDWP